MKQEQVRIEWWYDNAFYHLERGKVPLAFMQVFSNGSASVLTDDGKTYHTFENETDANIWLTDEEFSSLDSLFEDVGIDAVLDKLHLTLPK